VHGAQDMNVIRFATRLERRRFKVVENADNIPVKLRPNRGANQRCSVLRAEDQMNKDFGKRLGHTGYALSGLMMVRVDRVPRALPWADELSPFGLNNIEHV